MAVKFALLAALCIAQAFAFPSEGLGDEVNKALSNKDLKIVMGCFGQLSQNIGIWKEKLTKVPGYVVEDVEEEIREPVAEFMKQMEKPMAQIAIAVEETHRTVYTYLNRLNVVQAYGALTEGIKTIEGLMNGIRTEVNQVKVDRPELAEALDWFVRFLVYKLEVMVPGMRRDFGECLLTGNPNVVN